MSELDLRIGDRERGEVCERLGKHAAAGRLDVEELERRLDRANAAVFGRDLAALEADLPSLEPPRRLPAAPSRPRSLPLLPLLPLVIALIAVGIAASAAIGHPVPPPFILAALIWRFGLRRRRWTTL